MAELSGRHLAELHTLAAEVGVPRYRLLRRHDLVAEIEQRGGDGKTSERRREDAVEPDPATGILEVTPQRFGFLRLGGLSPGDDDVYISASQIRRCELRHGDEVSGPVRRPHRGERHRALVHVDAVNGSAPAEEDRARFDRLPARPPHRRLPLDSDPSDLLSRAIDLLVPLAFGQRVLLIAPPRSGRTTLLRGLASRLASLESPPELIVLLVDERPEEDRDWREGLPNAELAVAPAEMRPRDQVAVAGLALARAKRRVESGADVALIVDSLSRLAVAARDPSTVKSIFGAGRELEGEGSLTVIATVLGEPESGDPAAEAVITTENALLRLDPALAAQGAFPALAVAGCGVSNEEGLRDADELEAVRRLRGELAGMDTLEAAGWLRERLEATHSNTELLEAL